MPEFDGGFGTDYMLNKQRGVIMEYKINRRILALDVEEISSFQKLLLMIIVQECAENNGYCHTRNPRFARMMGIKQDHRIANEITALKNGGFITSITYGFTEINLPPSKKDGGYSKHKRIAKRRIALTKKTKDILGD